MYPNLRAEMVRKNITVEQLAEFLGIDISTLSRKLNGKSGFTFRETLTINDFLQTEMPVEVLFEQGVLV